MGKEARVRFEVRCTNRDCDLHHATPRYADRMAAETLAWAHEQRHIDNPVTHVVTVTDLFAPDPSKASSEAATGDKGGGHA